MNSSYLMDHMARLRDNSKLELALHLADHQLLIETFRTRKNKQASSSNRKERARKSTEPSYIDKTAIINLGD